MIKTKSRNRLLIILTLLISTLLVSFSLPGFANGNEPYAEVNGGEVTNGATFAGALGGSDYATYTQDPETGVYTVTLSGNVAPKYMIEIKSGSYILNGTGTISRAVGSTGTLIQMDSGVSLTLGGSVTIDGGADWGGSTPAAGAENTGIEATDSLIRNNGALTLTGNAVIENQASPMSSLTMSTVVGTGTFDINGGTIRNCSGRWAVTSPDTEEPITISGGTICGNLGSEGILASGDNQTLTISGGTVSGNTVTGNEPRCGVVREAYRIIITGGTFSDNNGCAVCYSNNTSEVAVSGGTFSGTRAMHNPWDT